MTRETVSGKISRITYMAQDTGYVIVRIETDDFDELTAVGTMPDAEKGTPVELRGEWVTHPKFGRQFKFETYSVPEPEGEAGIIAYLATLKGIKASLASRVYLEFGDDVFCVLDEEPERLLEVRGIGAKLLPKIVECYSQTKGIRQLIGFLHSVGVSASYAKRIYEQFKEDAIAEVKRDPYMLADMVRGFGFKKADEVARSLGIGAAAKMRIEAAVLHCLKGASNMKGHCYLEDEALYTEAAALLALPDYRPGMADVEVIVKGMKALNVKKWRRLVQPNGTNRIYMLSMYDAELGLARSLKRLAGATSDRDISAWIDQYQQRENVTLAEGQRNAVETVACNGLSVMTGGAGVGKSATSKAIIQYWHSLKKRVVALAPTGKAAQRIKEATGLQAQTIHRALGWSGQGFLKNAEFPIEADAFLIDEASMMDLKLAYALFEAIPAHATVLMVGDVDQLPSVGAGNVLRDLIESGAVPVCRLTQVFRQAGASQIISASHDINAGTFPRLEAIGRATDTPLTDALWVKCPQEKIASAIEWLIAEKLPELGWSEADIQVLSPMHKTDSGNIALNTMIQSAWNPKCPGQPDARGYRIGDRIIQNKNDYDRSVFNGDIGVIESIDSEEQELVVRFADPDMPAGRPVKYEYADLENTSLAYSISIHRSQGSEFPVVIMPASMQHFMMLQRNLYYTGITRAKKLLIVVGEEKAIATAVRTQVISQRNTGLCEMLAG